MSVEIVSPVKRRNLPVIHTGAIALFPGDERLLTIGIGPIKTLGGPLRHS